MPGEETGSYKILVNAYKGPLLHDSMDATLRGWAERFVEKGLLEAYESGSGPAYRLTEAGRRAVEEHMGIEPGLLG